MRAATWLTHLDFDWESPVWRHWLAGLGDGHTLVRYDERRVHAIRPRASQLLSTPGSPTSRRWSPPPASIASRCSASRRVPRSRSSTRRGARPERVTQLVLYGAYARGPQVARARGAPAPGGRDGLGRPRRLGGGEPCSVACSACCSCRKGPRSRWPGSTNYGGARRRPRPRRVSARCATASTPSSSHRG